MYFGSVDQRGLDAWLGRLLDDPLDEAVAGDCDHIELTFREANEIVVSNNGRGLPVNFAAYPTRPEVKAVPERRLLDYIMVIGSAKRVDGEYRIAPSMFNNALVPINAASEICLVEIKRDGHLWRQEYHQGVPGSDLVQIRNLGADEQTGTKIALRPDFTIFERNGFDYAQWVNRFQELACLLPNVTFAIRDERTGQHEDFHFPEGLIALLNELNRNRTPVHPVVAGHSTWRMQTGSRQPYTVTADIAFQYVDADDTVVLSYANHDRVAGGLFVDVALSEIYRRLDHSLKPFGSISRRSAMRGLTLVIHVRHPHPHLDSSSNPKLLNPDATPVVAAALGDAYSMPHRKELEAFLKQKGRLRKRRRYL
ncbi:MAG: hypothetical protein IPO91_31240 [Chloroflexi bacterium]|nr:hypothetical protein [Chloroflexota bacterium]